MACWKARGRLPISANWTFSPALTVEALWANIGRNCAVWKGWVTLRAKFRGKRGHPPTNFGVRKLRVPGLSRGVVCVILRLAVLIQYRRVTHTHTDRQTDTQWWHGYYPRIACAALVKINTIVKHQSPSDKFDRLHFGCCNPADWNPTQPSRWMSLTYVCLKGKIYVVKGKESVPCQQNDLNPFSRFYRTQTYHRQTDRRTDGQRAIANAAL